jgi:tetratricopeptide (TPR) repeat protein
VQRLEHAGMQLALQNDLKAQLKNWQQELPQEGTATTLAPNAEGGKIRTLRWQSLAAAASVLLVLGFFGQRWASSNYGSAALMHDVDTWSVNTRGSGQGETGNLALISQANQALEGKDFEEAMRVLNKADTVGFAISLLRAGAHFGLKAYPQAVESLQNAIQQAGTSLAKQEAEWKLAMVYVAMRDDAKAKALLQQIASNPDNDYAELATQTLEKLNSVWRKIAW